MISIVLGFLLSVGQYLGELVSTQRLKWIPSFAAGVSISYVFLDLFPQFSEGAQSISNFMFFFVLLGFTVLHVAEKLLYKHAKGGELRRELRAEHAVISFVYHGIVGVLLSYVVLNDGMFALFLFFVPSFLYTLISESPISIPSTHTFRIVVAASGFAGSVLGYFAPISFPMYVGLIGVVVGVVSYTVVRHAIPYGRKGSPWLFISGIFIYSVLIVLQWVS